MPLPCSPVSNSTASEASEQSFLTSEDSDDSLTTPRPGPADESQRTESNLSRPLVPPLSTSPANRVRDNSTWVTPSYTTSAGSPFEAARLSADQVSVSPGDTKANSGSQDRKRSVTFLPQTAKPKPSRESSYATHSIMTAGESPNRSPHSTARNRMVRDADDLAAESSADENTAIMRKNSSVRLNYGAAGADGNVAEQERFLRLDGQNESPQRWRSGPLPAKRINRNADQSAQDQDQTQGETGGERESWFKSLVDKYGSVELENKGSVARDHLALERTFLAWLRTSLSFASIGIAVTQLFRLNTAIAPSNPDTIVTFSPSSRLRSVGKPLGATFLGISILILLLGFHRYFESQHYVIRGKFPASRGTIVLVSAVATALIVASLIVVVAIAPQAFES